MAEKLKQEMELDILRNLNFRLSPPTPISFLQFLSNLPIDDVVVNHFAQYLAELSRLSLPDKPPRSRKQAKTSPVATSTVRSTWSKEYGRRRFNAACNPHHDMLFEYRISNLESEISNLESCSVSLACICRLSSVTL